MSDLGEAHRKAEEIMAMIENAAAGDSLQTEVNDAPKSGVTSDSNAEPMDHETANDKQETEKTGADDEAKDAELTDELGIEVTVPAELLGNEDCKLCEVHFNNPDMAKQHYGGKKHAHKENQYIRKIYEEKGINPIRFLHKPGSLRNQEMKEKSKETQLSLGAVPENRTAQIDVEKFKFSCFLCGLHFQEYEHVELHVKTAMHAQRIWEYQMSGYEDPSDRESGYDRSRWYADDWPEDFYCKICDKQLNSADQYEQHIASKKHTSKLNQLVESGSPWPGAPPNKRGRWGGSSYGNRDRGGYGGGGGGYSYGGGRGFRDDYYEGAGGYDYYGGYNNDFYGGGRDFFQNQSDYYSGPGWGGWGSKSYGKARGDSWWGLRKRSRGGGRGGRRTKDSSSKKSSEDKGKAAQPKAEPATATETTGSAEVPAGDTSVATAEPQATSSTEGSGETSG